MVISSYCEFLLERMGLDATLRRSVQEIANAGERAASLTRQLLTFSRKKMLAPKVVDLNALVKGNLHMLTRMIGKDIEFVMIAVPEIGAVKADPGQIDQVIMNLAVNARDGNAGSNQAEKVILKRGKHTGKPMIQNWKWGCR